MIQVSRRKNAKPHKRQKQQTPVYTYHKLFSSCFISSDYERKEKRKLAVLRNVCTFGKSERVLLNTWNPSDPSSSLLNTMTMAMLFNFTEPVSLRLKWSKD